tara:strand:+ start:400 stop:654 length:255 start_codon:yes stop_codon:yes gene_type:complete
MAGTKDKNVIMSGGAAWVLTDAEYSSSFGHSPQQITQTLSSGAKVNRGELFGGRYTHPTFSGSGGFKNTGTWDPITHLSQSNKL